MIKYLALIIILAASAAFADSIKTGIYMMPGYHPSAAQYTWLKNNIDLNSNSNLYTTSADINGFSRYMWAGYQDIATLASAPQYLELVDFANSKGIDAEEVLLHSKIDFTFPTKGVAWSGADKFDAYEGANGVLLETGGTFTEKTTVAYSGASPYTTLNQNMYLGYELPFDRVIVNIRTAASNLVGTWQYWNGTSWITLSTTDGTTNMVVSGTISFIPPSNWARTIVNGSRNKYFIRYAYTSASTAPIINTIKRDNWITPGTANSQWYGWDDTDPNIINSGELRYNPTPPAGASARFKYQARVMTWGIHRALFNPADFQTINSVSTRTVAAFLAYKASQLVSTVAFNGMMFDDATILLTQAGSGIAEANTDFVDKATGASWTTVENAKYADLVTQTKILQPALIVGANTKTRVLTNAGDWNLYEFFNGSPATADSENTLLATSDSTGNMTYDDYAPPSTKTGLLVYKDMSDYSYQLGVSAGTFWDRSNRGPMSMLTKHLIGMNDNTYFSYTKNNSWYSEVDDVYYLDPLKGTTLTQPLTVNTTTPVTIYGYDFSQFPNGTSVVKIDNPSAPYNNNDILTIIKTAGINDRVVSVSSPTSAIRFTHAIGDRIRFSAQKLQSDGMFRPYEDVLWYGAFFPAMKSNIGTALEPRNTSWVVGSNQNPSWGTGIKNNVWKREFTNALVLHRPSGGAASGSNDYEALSQPIDLGGTYFPLTSDGTTRSAITSIQLRRSEGAILMKSPIGSASTNGICGFSNNQTLSSTPTSGRCASGNPSIVTGQYSWTCDGINGGNTASCSATYSAGSSTTTASPPGGSYVGTQTVVLTCSGPCSKIQYCTADSTCTPSIDYTGPIVVTATGYVRHRGSPTDIISTEDIYLITEETSANAVSRLYGPRLTGGVNVR